MDKTEKELKRQKEFEEINLKVKKMLNGEFINSTFGIFVRETIFNVINDNIKSTVSGSSGFIINFKNKHLIVNLNKGIVDLSIKYNEISEDDIQKINFIDDIDIFDFKKYKKRIKEQGQNYAEILSNLHDKYIIGVTPGENGFTLYFPDNFRFSVDVTSNKYLGRKVLWLLWSKFVVIR